MDGWRALLIGGLIGLAAAPCALGQSGPGPATEGDDPLSLPPSLQREASAEMPQAVSRRQDEAERATIEPSPSQRSSPPTAAPRRVRPVARVTPVSGDAGLEPPVRQAADRKVLLPLATPPPAPDVQLDSEDDLVTLVATGAELSAVLRMIAEHHRLNLVLGPDVSGPVTVSIHDARLEEVLDAILGVAGLHWHRTGNLLYVTSATATDLDPRVQGQTVRVYPLNYVAAADLEATVNGLLSPSGSAFISESDPADQLRTREVLVVEDTAEAHRRIAQFIAQIDVPPRQVLVEAHVLQVDLDEKQRHGIDLSSLARLGHSKVTLEGAGFADSGTGPSLSLHVDGTDMDGVLQLIRQRTASRTLASPKLSVVNHQEAKIQIGERLPYSVSTTTQTTTVETVEFLEVGIVLTIQPVITDDGQVLMTVFPKVSDGTITANGYPEEKTTEVSTTILMRDGGGCIIGGLIQEDDVEQTAEVPGLSRVPWVGKLFQRSSHQTRRNELIVALVTHVLPAHNSPRAREYHQLQKTLPPYAGAELRYREHPPGLHEVPPAHGEMPPAHGEVPPTRGDVRIETVPSPPAEVQRPAPQRLELAPPVHRNRPRPSPQHSGRHRRQHASR